MLLLIIFSDRTAVWIFTVWLLNPYYLTFVHYLLSIGSLLISTTGSLLLDWIIHTPTDRNLDPYYLIFGLLLTNLIYGSLLMDYETPDGRLLRPPLSTTGLLLIDLLGPWCLGLGTPLADWRLGPYYLTVGPLLTNLTYGSLLMDYGAPVDWLLTPSL